MAETKTTLARFSLDNIMAHVSAEVGRLECENAELRRQSKEVESTRGITEHELVSLTVTRHPAPDGRPYTGRLECSCGYGGCCFSSDATDASECMWRAWQKHQESPDGR